MVAMKATTSPLEASADCIPPEFVNHRGLRSGFGISRSQAYELSARGLVRTVCLRKPGSIRGKRLWEVASVRAYLNSCVEENGVARATAQQHQNKNTGAVKSTAQVKDSNKK